MKISCNNFCENQRYQREKKVCSGRILKILQIQVIYQRNEAIHPNKYYFPKIKPIGAIAGIIF
jgi:hypothetical protein